MWGWEMNEVERISKKPYPWPAIADYSPDCNPSSGAIHIEAVGERVVAAMEVRGLGVIVLTALPPNFDDATGRVKFEGTMSTFTNEEIGYTEKLK
jgi:hypothetical protein